MVTEEIKFASKNLYARIKKYLKKLLKKIFPPKNLFSRKENRSCELKKPPKIEEKISHVAYIL